MRKLLTLILLFALTATASAQQHLTRQNELEFGKTYTRSGTVIGTALTKIRYEFHGSDFTTSDTITCTARSFSSACTTATYYEDRVAFKMDNCRLLIDQPYYPTPGSAYSEINNSRMRITREFTPTSNPPAGSALNANVWNTAIIRDGTSKAFFEGIDISKFEDGTLDWNDYK